MSAPNGTASTKSGVGGTVSPAMSAEQPRVAEERDVVGGAVGVRAVGCRSRRSSTTPDPGWSAAELLVADALRGAARRGRPDSTTTSTLAISRRSTSRRVLVLQVERHRALAAVVRGLRARDHARRVAGPGRLDPQHVGAEVGEHAGAVRTRLQAGQVEDPQVRQRPVGHRRRAHHLDVTAQRRRVRVPTGRGVLDEAHHLLAPRNGESTRATVNSCPA